MNGRTLAGRSLPAAMPHAVATPPHCSCDSALAKTVEPTVSTTPASVLPFILRGVQLVGINSVDAPNTLRDEAWALLDESVNTNAIRTEEVGLDGVEEVGRALLEGRGSGRAVVTL